MSCYAIIISDPIECRCGHPPVVQCGFCGAGCCINHSNPLPLGGMLCLDCEESGVTVGIACMELHGPARRRP
jgi:hypothetical protein